MTSKASNTAAINPSVTQHTKLQMNKATSFFFFFLSFFFFLQRTSSTDFNSNTFIISKHFKIKIGGSGLKHSDILALLSTLLEKEWLFLRAV